MILKGFFLDGKTSQRLPAELSFTGLQFRLTTLTASFFFRRDQVKLQKRLGTTARVFEFPDSQTFETFEIDLVDELAKTLKISLGVTRFEKSWRWVVAAIALTGAISYLVLGVFLPQIAEWVAPLVPERYLGEFSSQIKKATLAKPEDLKLTKEQNLELKIATERIQTMFPAYKGEFLVFDMKNVGANAFTLPDSTILITKELLATLADKDQLTAVLLHEMGHVDNRHFLRQLIQGSGVTVFLFATVGVTDFNAVPMLFLTLSYSRKFETEADLFASRALRKIGLSSKNLAQALERLEASQPKGFKVPGFLSNHPITSERIRLLNSESKN